MKQVLSFLLYWIYIPLSASFPVEEKPGFTLWPLEKRDLTPISELQFSGLKGTELGTSAKSHFGIPDPTCRGRLPGPGCWTMDEFTMNKMIAARKPEANNCQARCLFYTEKLSGAAERTAGWVLWDYLHMGAIEEKGTERNFQTIWDLHDRKYYPKGDDLDATPETKCAYLDADPEDRENGFSGCQRKYFMSMSKAMAAECSGEVFLLTRSNLRKLAEVPEDGIWWQVEFPTLIDPRRAEEKKVTKITYIQVEDLTDEEFDRLKALPDDEKTPPKEVNRAEYWPVGPGQIQLDKFKAPIGIRGDSQQKHSSSLSNSQEDPEQEHSPTIGFVKRASDTGSEICAFGDECYTYPYPIKDMYEYYKGIAW